MILRFIREFLRLIQVYLHISNSPNAGRYKLKCFIAEKHYHSVLKIALGITKNALIMSLIT